MVQSYTQGSFFSKIKIECFTVLIEMFSNTIFKQMVNFALWKSNS